MSQWMHPKISLYGSRYTSGPLNLTMSPAVLSASRKATSQFATGPGRSMRTQLLPPRGGGVWSGWSKRTSLMNLSQNARFAGDWPYESNFLVRNGQSLRINSLCATLQLVSVSPLVAKIRLTHSRRNCLVSGDSAAPGLRRKHEPTGGSVHSIRSIPFPREGKLASSYLFPSGETMHWLH